MVYFQKCIICKEKIIGYGHNARPMKGKCCDGCHSHILLKRFKELKDGLDK